MKRLGLLTMLLGMVAMTVGCPAEPETTPGVDVGGGYTTPDVPMAEVVGEEPAEAEEGSGSGEEAAEAEEGSGDKEAAADAPAPEPTAETPVTPPPVITPPPVEQAPKPEAPKSETPKSETPEAK